MPSQNLPANGTSVSKAGSGQNGEIPGSRKFSGPGIDKGIGRAGLRRATRETLERLARRGDDRAAGRRRRIRSILM